MICAHVWMNDEGYTIAAVGNGEETQVTPVGAYVKCRLCKTIGLIVVRSVVEPCWTCGGVNDSLKPCICGGSNSHQVEVNNLRLVAMSGTTVATVLKSIVDAVVIPGTGGIQGCTLGCPVCHRHLDACVKDVQSYGFPSCKGEVGRRAIKEFEKRDCYTSAADQALEYALKASLLLQKAVRNVEKALVVGIDVKEIPFIESFISEADTFLRDIVAPEEE